MSKSKLKRFKFPAAFQFGVGSSAYQIEGAWNEDGKSESIWDTQTHNFPSRFHNQDNADIACDSYHQYGEDIANLKLLHVDFYRFSLSWTRILPTGFPNHLNQPGIDYYKNLINRLLDNGIQPVVTLHHWDLPQSLQDLGGWTNPIVAEYFAAYARICFANFGTHVKTWMTLDSPNKVARAGYGSGQGGGGGQAPFVDSDGIGTYLAGHNMLLAHAKAYQVYQQEFREQQRGIIGLAVDCPWFEPFTTARGDNEAAERVLQMYIGWFAHPIFSSSSELELGLSSGDYPIEMRQCIDKKSEDQGFPISRLPRFTDEEASLVKGSADFFGLNHFACYYVTEAHSVGLEPSNDNDMGAHCFVDDRWQRTAKPLQRVIPWGISSLLRWIKDRYNGPTMLIAGNGYAGYPEDDDELKFDDIERIDYFIEYLKEILNAMKDHDCRVMGYTAWPLMDCFEWTDSYSIRSGLFFVNFKDPERKRRARRSVFLYRNIAITHRVVESSIDIGTFAENNSLNKKKHVTMIANHQISADCEDL